MDTDQTRRLFLGQAGASLGLYCLSSMTPDLLAKAHAYGQSPHAGKAQTYRFFTPQQAAEFDAFSAQIIPTDDTPGAREANVVHFTDYVLSTIDRDQQAPVNDAFKALQEQVAKTVPGATSFAAITPAQQIAVMKAMEKYTGVRPSPRLHPHRLSLRPFAGRRQQRPGRLEAHRLPG